MCAKLSLLLYGSTYEMIWINQCAKMTRTIFEEAQILLWFIWNIHYVYDATHRQCIRTILCCVHIIDDKCVDAPVDYDKTNKEKKYTQHN